MLNHKHTFVLWEAGNIKGKLDLRWGSRCTKKHMKDELKKLKLQILMMNWTILELWMVVKLHILHRQRAPAMSQNHKLQTIYKGNSSWNWVELKLFRFLNSCSSYTWTCAAHFWKHLMFRIRYMKRGRGNTLRDIGKREKIMIY